MDIPELNQEQVNLLTNMVSGVGAFSHVVPDPKRDSVKDYEEGMVILRDNEQLVILGLIKELTDESTQGKLANMYSMTGRMFRVYQATDIAYKLFDGVERPIQ